MCEKIEEEQDQLLHRIKIALIRVRTMVDEYKEAVEGEDERGSDVDTDLAYVEGGLDTLQSIVDGRMEENVAALVDALRGVIVPGEPA